MAVRSDVEFGVKLTGEDALGPVVKKAAQDAMEAARSFSAVSAAAIGLNQGLELAKKAWAAIGGTVMESLKEFQEAQDGQRNLVNVLRLTGDNVRETFGAFQDFSSHIADTTVVSNDAAIKMLTMAKTMGLTNDQAEKLVKTSADLAATTGETVEQAFQGLSMTFKGNARGIGEMAVLLRDLTKEELEAGAGVDRLASMLSGQAEEATKTFKGSLEVTANAVKELKQTFGGIIAAIFNLEQGSSTISEKLKELNKWVTANADSFVAMGKTVISLADDLKNILMGALTLVDSGLVKLADGVLMAYEGYARLTGLFMDNSGHLKAIEGIRAKVLALSDTLDNKAAASFLAVGNTGDSSLEQLAKKTDLLGDKAKATSMTLKSIGPSLVEAKKEGVKALEDIQKKITELQERNAQIGANEGQIVRQRAAQQEAEVEAMQRKLAAAGMLKGKNAEFIQQAKDLVAAGQDKELGVLRKKNLDDYILKNKELGIRVKEDSMTKQQLIDAETNLQIEQLRIKAKSLELDAAGNAALEEQIDLLKQQAEIAKSKAPSEQYQGLEKAGQNIADGISGVLTKGALDMVGGMAAGAGAIVDAISGLLDFFPNFINKIGDLFDKITNFPKVLMDAVTHLATAFVGMIKDFIPNLLTELPKMLDTIVDTVFTAVPEAIENLISSLPDLLNKFVEKMPDIVSKFVSGFLTQVPEIAIELTKGFIEKGPEIGFIIAKAFIWDLPVAIVKGVIDAAKKLWDMLKGLFIKPPKIKLPKEVDEIGGKISSSIKKAFSGDKSKLFAVSDLVDAAKAATPEDLAKKAVAIVDEAVEKMKSWWEEAWEGLKKWGARIWHGFLEAIGDVVAWFKEKGKMLWNGFVEAVGDLVAWFKDKGAMLWRGFVEAVGDIAAWFGEKGAMIWTGFTGAVKDIAAWFADKGTALWNGFVKAIGDAAKWFGDRGTEIWKGLIVPIGTWFADRGKEIWDGLVKPVASWFEERGAAIWNGLIKPVASWFEDRGAAIWNGLIKPVASWFEDRGAAIWNGLVKPVATWFSEKGKEIWDGIIKPVATWFKDRGKEIWDGLVGPVKTWFSDKGKEIWDGLKGLFKWPEAPKWLTDFKWPTLKIPDWLDKFSWPSISVPSWIANFSWPEFKVPGWLQSFIDAVSKLASIHLDTGGLVGKINEFGGKVSESYKKSDIGKATSNIGDVLSGKKHLFAKGGPVYAAEGFFAPRGTDVVPAMLTPGEYVVNQRATTRNFPIIDAINKGRNPASLFRPNIVAVGGGGGGGGGVVIQNLVINSKLDTDIVRREVIPQLEQHLKRKSQDGAFVLSTNGIRR